MAHCCWELFYVGKKSFRNRLDKSLNLICIQKSFDILRHSNYVMCSIFMINATFILKCFLHDLVLFAGPHYKVHCTKDNLRVDVVKHEDVSAIYLQHLKDYPGERFFALKFERFSQQIFNLVIKQ